MNGHRIGYIRVSSIDQCIDRQLVGIQVDKKFIDKSSGKDRDREDFNKMMAYLRTGDHLLVHSMDRLSRNLMDLRNIVEELVKRNVKVEFIKEGLIFTGEDSPMSMLTLSLLGAFSEFERSLIKERQREGIDIAKKKGLFKGKKFFLNQEEVNDILNRIAAGQSKASIARFYNLSTACIYQYLKREKLKMQNIKV